MRYLKKFEGAELDVDTASEELMLDMSKSSSTMGAKPERALMKYILKATDIYHGMSIKELKTLAFNYAKVINIEYRDE
ncbi:unnamed protein product [Hermetia illucens]|uniref:Uncharacterized protein n=1 Tax=Hermetia illucens TaxID=343691 RepID=A0A7R8YZR6_HERIL|nr:unnamed protein product [Hermetia illucens]